MSHAPRSAIAVVLAASVALTGCAAGSSGTSRASAKAGGALAKTGLPGGRSMLLARRVSGCAPAPLNSTDSASPGLATHPSALAQATSAATCTLRGRTTVILTFANAGDQRRADTELARVDSYYATGTTSGTRWSAAPEQVTAVSGEQSIVQDIALALRGLIQQGLAQ